MSAGASAFALREAQFREWVDYAPVLYMATSTWPGAVTCALITR